jgi:hypothetical protein
MDIALDLREDLEIMILGSILKIRLRFIATRSCATIAAIEQTPRQLRELQTALTSCEGMVVKCISSLLNIFSDRSCEKEKTLATPTCIAPKNRSMGIPFSAST